MKEVKALRRNSVSSIIYQITVIISGFILPRVILLAYGSKINGLQASINQFLYVINFFELGIGTVIQAQLYRPIHQRNQTQINAIMSAAKQFFNRLSLIFVLYLLGLVILYPLMATSPMDLISTVLLILASSIALLAQYYIGILNQLYLNAEQKAYIQINANLVVVVITTMVSVGLIQLGVSIIVVRLVAGLIFLLKALYLRVYVKKHYPIKFNAAFDNHTIQQKWNGMAQHIAYVVLTSTDIIVITLFASLSEVSIYSVYALVVNGIKQLMTAPIAGIQSFYGGLLAKDEVKQVQDYLEKFEWMIHTIAIFLFAMTGSLILDFISLYTQGVNDANYNQPLFGLILVMAQFVYCLRIPYHTLINGAGHFKQTQVSAIIEASLNLLISMVFVYRMGIIGVALGTLIAVGYRLVYYGYYLSKAIIEYPLSIFFKRLSISFGQFGLLIGLGKLIPIQVVSMFGFVIKALVLGVIFIWIQWIINQQLFGKNLFKIFFKLIKRR